MPTSSNPFYGDFSGAFDAPMVGFQGIARNDLQLRAGEQELAQMSVEGPLKAEHSRLVNDKLKAEAAKSAELRALFGTTELDPDKPLSKQALAMAQRVGQVDFNLASQYLTLADKFALNEARGELADAREAEARAKALERNTNWLYSVIGDVATPQAYEARKMQLLSSPGLLATEENRALLQSTPFEAYRAFPQLVEVERKKAELAVRQQRANDYKRFADSAESNAATRAAGEARRETQGATNGKLTGPRPIERPSPEDVRQALLQLKNSPEGKGLGGPQLSGAAADIAARAMRIRRENPALDIQAARARALRELVETKALQSEEGTFGGTRWRYNAIGASVTPPKGPSGAAPKPITISSQDEYAKLPDGAAFIWNGKAYTKGKK